jgi:TolB-like protein
MAMDLRQIGNELGVRYAIEGSVQATSSPGINARLVDA